MRKIRCPQQFKYILKVILVFLLIWVEAASAKIKAQNRSEKTMEATLDSIRNNPSGKMYFFNGKQISEESFYRKALNGELNGLSGTGAEAGKEAIIKYGELYRHGVLFFESKEKTINHESEEQLPILTQVKNQRSKSCRQNDEYKLKGTINRNFDGNTIMLFSFNQDTIMNVDTTLIVDGYFEFNGNENLKDIGILSIGNYPDSVLSQTVILEHGNINVSLNKKTIGGTSLNNLFQSYLDSMAVLTNELQSIPISEDSTSYIKTGTALYNKHVEIGKYRVNFKKTNIHNIVGQYFFKNEVGKGTSEGIAYPSQNNLDSAFLIVYDAADAEYKQSKWIKKYIERLKLLKEKELLQKNMENKLFTNLILKDSLGESKEISEYVAKSQYILIDFWASWCAPCIASFPALKEIYNNFKREELEIIGISLDTNESAWKNTLNKQQLPWVQLVTSNEEMNERIMKIYSFQSIPFAVLIDKEGNIIKTGFSVESISKLIKSKGQ